MSTITEIESAIEKLPSPEVEELAAWLEAHLARRDVPTTVENWLTQARGAAQQGTSTDSLLTLTRGEE